jgi:hypothetical protein
VPKKVSGCGRGPGPASMVASPGACSEAFGGFELSGAALMASSARRGLGSL